MKKQFVRLRSGDGVSAPGEQMPLSHRSGVRPLYAAPFRFFLPALPGLPVLSVLPALLPDFAFAGLRRRAGFASSPPVAFVRLRGFGATRGRGGTDSSFGHAAAIPYTSAMPRCISGYSTGLPLVMIPTDR